MPPGRLKHFCKLLEPSIGAKEIQIPPGLVIPISFNSKVLMQLLEAGQVVQTGTLLG
jgi:hypothetical protein